MKRQRPAANPEAASLESVDFSTRDIDALRESVRARLMKHFEYATGALQMLAAQRQEEMMRASADLQKALEVSARGRAVQAETHAKIRLELTAIQQVNDQLRQETAAAHKKLQAAELAIQKLRKEKDALEAAGTQEREKATKAITAIRLELAEARRAASRQQSVTQPTSHETLLADRQNGHVPDRLGAMSLVDRLRRAELEVVEEPLKSGRTKVWIIGEYREREIIERHVGQRCTYVKQGSRATRQRAAWYVVRG